MTVNVQASFGRYVVLPDRGPYQLDFRVQPVGQKAVTARFKLERPT